VDPWTLLLIGLAALVTSTMTAVLGFGGGIVLLALLLLVVEPVVAIPLHAAIQIASNGTRTVIRRRDVDWSIVVPASLLLLPAGFLVLPLALGAPASALQAAIAVTVLLATWVPERSDLRLPAPSPVGWIGVGGVLGGLNVLVGATGPLQAPLFRAATVTRQGFVGTFAASQVANHVAKLAVFGVAGLAPTRHLGAAAAGIVGVVAGTELGSRVLDGLSEARYRNLYLGAITAVGLFLLTDALLG
jgi:uncharacterized membrane protein YfcA